MHLDVVGIDVIAFMFETPPIYDHFVVKDAATQCAHVGTRRIL
jgi:hypothetical protein